MAGSVIADLGINSQNQLKIFGIGHTYLTSTQEPEQPSIEDNQSRFLVAMRSNVRTSMSMWRRTPDSICLNPTGEPGPWRLANEKKPLRFLDLARRQPHEVKSRSCLATIPAHDVLTSTLGFVHQRRDPASLEVVDR